MAQLLRGRPVTRLALCAALGLFISIGCLPVHAQNAQGTMVGHVQDPTGAVVPHAKVSVKETSTGVVRTVYTNATGDYYVPDLNPGSYSITVSAPGFSMQQSTGLTLEVEQTLRDNFKLQMGNVSSTVHVSDTTQMLDTDDNTVGQVLHGKMIEQLPISGRDFTNLMLTDIGTNITPGGSGTDWSYHGLDTEYMEVSVDGAQAQSTNYTIDGIDDADYFFSVPINIPNELAVQEFKMENGMYGAEYGTGVAQVNVAIKSGQNRFHGAAYESLQANWMQPDNLYVKAQNELTGSNTPLSTPYHQNQFGGTISGPLWIPHVYNGKNKTFFFLSYDEGLYSATNSASNVFSPTAAELNGDFSAWPFPIYNPATTVANPAYNPNLPAGPGNSPVIRQAFPNNQIPQGMINPIAKQVAAYFDVPNVSTCGESEHILTGCQNYSGNTYTKKTTGVGTGRIDQYFGRNDHVFLTVNIGNLSQTNTSINFGQGGTTYARPKLFGATWTHIFNANTVNQATLGYDRDHFFTGPTTAYGPNLSAQVGFQNTNTNPVTFDLPNICLTFYYCIGGGEPTTYVDNIYQGVDTVTMTRGRQTFNFGIDFRRVNLFELDNYGGTGSLSFNGQYTASVPSDAGSQLNSGGSYSSTAPYEGNAVADFVLGDPNSASGPPPLGTDDYFLWGNNWNLFFQDDFRVTSNLTLNMGLRWERPPNFHSSDNSGYAFNTANGGQLVWANCNFVKPILAAGGNPNYLGCGASNTLVPIDKKDFAPRIGFAYRPPDIAKLVVRGGFGIFYGSYNRYYDGTQFDKNSIYNEAAAPYTSTTGQETQSTAYMSNLWSAPITANQSFSLPAWQFPYNQVNWPTNHTPYDEQWNLDTQYSLNQHLMLDVGYVGDHGLRQPSQDILGAATPPTVAGDVCNNLVDASQATGSNANCASDPNFQPIDTRQPYPNLPPYLYGNRNGFQSTYNALQVQLIERMTHGLSYHVNYTYSKTMDLTSGINLVNGEPGLIQDPQHPYREYGLAASDQTHRLVATYAYEVPAFFHKGLLNLLTAGWTTSGVYQLSSGFPFAVNGGEPSDQMAEDYASRILANSTFKRTPGFKSSLSNWFDTSEYSTPALGRYGNTNKSPERTPFFTNLDASFGKTTNLPGGQSLLIRAEIFNVGSTWHSSTSKIFPDSTVTDTNFGSLVNAQYGAVSLWNPRILQLTAQYSF
jgi:hypothetical protein